MSTYKQAREDFEYLETLAECSDQITILNQVQDFMKEPTRAFAKGLYEQSIQLWFYEHGLKEIATSNKRVARIYNRHNIA